jgi:hypothetical protein
VAAETVRQGKGRVADGGRRRGAGGGPAAARYGGGHQNHRQRVLQLHPPW